ncbi:MAG: four helix bundle protein [Candidatus Cyclonatronum sp.]|uniref:four helix bundle protein n=1 Tax=Cyclonatronum sp. TaxID=3024185 RepID=UPI0025BC119A|nr:four helix bundle protein [Cyclonatronum sp.]MCC5934711.1 four helix bundle protein [Balneolales bacterium]MCH8488112.1 four helix bundle protein [Cyclonatronum sp.]
MSHGLNNNIYNKAYKFAVQVVFLHKQLNSVHKEYAMARQILRSGTSIGANIAEANGAISKADFNAKMYISYKESLEVKYWLNLLKDTGYLTKEQFEKMYQDADELSRILYTIVRRAEQKL